MAKTSTKKQPKQRRVAPERALTQSSANGEWVTPYAYAKTQSDLRPQVVYQWVLKQGAPCNEIAGKIYVNAAELTEWQSHKGERKKERSEKVAARKQDKGTVSNELLQLLMHPCPLHPNAWCDNCQQATDWVGEIEWLDLDMGGPFKQIRCSSCHLNVREYPIEQERAIDAMKGLLTLRVPLHTSLQRLDNEQWLGVDAPEDWEPPIDAEDDYDPNEDEESDADEDERESSGDDLGEDDEAKESPPETREATTAARAAREESDE